MDSVPQNETFERIMDAAEELFMTRGYKAVRLRDIAAAVGMRHASLYYYVPQGKEQLFVAVLRRGIERHAREMARLVEEAGNDICRQAYAVSDWLVSQPPLDMVRIVEADLQEIAPAVAAELSELLLNALTRPLAAALRRAHAAGEVVMDDAEVAAMALIGLVQSVRHVSPQRLPEGRKALGRRLVDMLLYGWLPRETKKAL